MSLTKEDRLERAGEAVSTTVDGSVVILHIEEGIYYQLDGTGSRLWELLEKPISFEELVSTLVAEYEVDERRCRADADALLGELLERRMVRRLDAI